jgi:CBS domain protein
VSQRAAMGPAPVARPRTARRAGGPLASTFGLGRIAGVEIGLNWTWLLIFASGRRRGEYLIPAYAVPRFSPATPAGEAADELARGACGRELIVEDGELVGILSLSDIARALAFGRPV